jgi:hypothetical protein
VQILLGLLGQSEQVENVADADMLIVQTPGRLDNSVILREADASGKYGLQKRLAGWGEERGLPPPEL